MGPRYALRIITRLVAVVWRAGYHLALGLLLPRAQRPLRLRRALQGLGGLYIKLGQLLAFQPDILSEPFRRALYDLLDRVPPFPLADIERTFREDLGQTPTALFDDFETRPMSAASVGQVHLATLGGRRLAVKVRRPDVDLAFGTDLALMAAVRRLILGLRWRRLGWLAQMLEELATWTREELDYTCEARYMAALEIHARDNPHERIPRLVGELGSRRVLVAEMLEGPTALAWLRHRERPDPAEVVEPPTDFDAEVFADHLVRNFVTDAFEHGLFHADLHPANLLILPHNVVGYVDFGITGSLSPHSRRHIVQLTLALAQGDHEAMLHSFLRLSRSEPWADLGRFERQFRQLCESWHPFGEATPRLRKSFSEIMADMLRLSRATGVFPGIDTVRYLRSVIAADGLIRQLAPELDIESLLITVCREVLEHDLARQLRPLGMARRAMQGARWLVEAPPKAAIALRRLEGLRSGQRGGRQGGGQGSQMALLVTLLAWGVLLVTGPPSRLGVDMGSAALLVGFLGMATGWRLLTTRQP